ncbi:MAG: lamin tail domain-containing protein [Verrucomicrobiota bacterium]
MRIWICVVLTLFSISVQAQSIRISEVMSDNDDTLLDEDGGASDWIELYNASNSSVDLTGWHLSDDAGNLTQWTFPATTIPAKGFLIVFASDKNRAVAGQELHTNFKLSSSGEYIALVQANGTTVEDDHSFGALEEDGSYGYTFTSNATSVLLDAGASCTARIPTSSSDASGWKELGFSDAGWRSGTTGVGYEAGSGYASLIGLDVIAMRNTNASVYIRVPFTASNTATVNSLILKMKYDDGFVAYINGVKVASSSNVPADPAWNSQASGIHNDSSAVIFQSIDLSNYVGTLQDGNNVLAIHGLNATLGSSDMLIVPRLEATDGDINSSEIGILASPTPGTANSSIGYAGLVDDEMSVVPARGFYDSTVNVTITNPTAGAEIRYTTDGSVPTASSTLYTGPVAISTTTTLRSRAFRSDWKPSHPRTDTYIFAADVASQPKTTDEINGQDLEYGMDAGVLAKTYYDASGQLVTVEDALKAIPSISLTTDDANLYGPSTGIYVNAEERWEVPASAELIYPDGTEGFHINAGLRIRGGASRTSTNPKHSFRIFFRGEYGTGKLRYPLFEDEGVEEFDKIDLRTAQNYSWSKDNSSRNTFLRDVFARDAAADMGQAYTRSRYYHLYLNGEYWGLFMTEERPEAAFGASYLGGDRDDYDTIKVIGRGQSDAYSIEATDGTTDAYERLYNAAMAGFTNNADYFSIQGLDANGEPDASQEKLLDVDNLIDYLLVIHYMAASDNAITWFVGGFEKLNNMYAIYNRANPDGFKWIQHDSEHSLDTSKQDDFTGPFTHSNFTLFKYFNPMTLHDKLVANEEYRLKFADRVYKHLDNGGVMTLANSQARLDNRAAQIDRAIVANAARWGNVSRDRDTWVSAVATARAWLARSGERCDEVIGYYVAGGLIPSVSPPSLNLSSGLVNSGTLVSLSAATGTIYYTTDGTDPRAVGGGIVGISYNGAITISRPTQLKARVLSSIGEWSALAEATYWTPESPLAVTELMYHSPEGNPHDFIEIQNISDQTVTLKGYKLDNAIDFKFKNAAQTSLAPGEYLVAVDDVDAFNSTYPSSGAMVAGEFSGDFSNNGEKVDLEFRNHDLISFTYGDARNWPQAADGGGHSLVPIVSAIETQERGSLDYGGNWRASSQSAGSPGYADPEPNVSVVLNEIWAHTDTGLAPPNDSNDKIELYNASDAAVTISGWYLSDSIDDIRKWLIPDTLIPAGGYVVFDETDFHASEIEGFGLNKAGEEVVLSSPAGIVDVVRFKGQENESTGVSWGRYPNGTGDWMMTLSTRATTNHPATPTVRISEVMYHPAQSGNDYEYILIENVGTATHTFANSTGTYRIDGGVEYTFPAGITLAAGERLWILSFNPVDTVRLNAFCSVYGLNIASETFLGGYSGSLSDRAERVAIERPQASDDPLRPLDISWVVVDEVFYFDQSPWPSGSDGTGYPLVRTGLSSWGAPSATDTDADRIQDSWELLYFSEMIDPDADPDSDGYSNLDEFIGGTSPIDASSYFKVQDIALSSLSWNTIAGRTYSIYRTADLKQPFVKIATTTSSPFVDTTTDPEQSTYFYKIVVELTEE